MARRLASGSPPDVVVGVVQKSAQRATGLLEAAPDAIVGVDAGGRIALVNAQAERLFGYPREELIGQPVEILVPEHAQAIHPAHRGRYLADLRPRPLGAGMELAGRRRDGSAFPAEISLSAVDTDEGVLIAAAIRDVTDRKRATDAQNLLVSIVQSSHDAIISKTLDGVITSWNPGAERLYGHTAEEVVGCSAEVLLPPEQYADEQEMLRRVARGERIDQYQGQRVHKDGSRLTVSLSASPIVDATGAVVGVAAVSRDITERTRMERKFGALLDAAPDAIIQIDASGRIALVNAQAERLFGYRREEMVGQLVEMLVPHGARRAHPGHRDRYLAEPRPRPMGAGSQLAARRKDGTEFPAEISLSAVDTDEGTLVSVAIRDVTDRLEAQAERERLKSQADRERLERRLHQSQRLESLGQLAGGVAHDFNNLLAVILNYASFVSEEIADAAAREGAERWQAARADMGQVQRAAERATRLTHQLLAFGRREVVRPEVLDLNTVVTEVEQLLRRTLGEHVELVTERAPGLWRITVDPGQIEQVLVNLAVNARDAMPGGGTLMISTGNLVVDEAYASSSGEPPGRYVRLRISDTGSGMSKDVVDRAFEPFFTTKPKGEGTGLGLATVYGIIAQAEGHVHIYSEVGHGTTFTMTFPATDAELTEADDRGPQVQRSRGGETVLVVEDEDAMREVTRRILARNGYQVVTAATGADALQLIDGGEDVDLLLTDVVMPQMLGTEVAERIRAVRPGIRVLYMSGYAQPVLASQGTLAPGLTLVEKPFSEPILLDKVREVLDANV
jgi:two-component system, cell cycle sensor histidine kinase and response regulator CckA